MNSKYFSIDTYIKEQVKEQGVVNIIKEYESRKEYYNYIFMKDVNILNDIIIFNIKYGKIAVPEDKLINKQYFVKMGADVKYIYFKKQKSKEDVTKKEKLFNTVFNNKMKIKKENGHYTIKKIKNLTPEQTIDNIWKKVLQIAFSIFIK